MAIENSNFESLASGTVPTTSNTNFDAVAVGTGNTLVTDNAYARGTATSSLRFQTASVNGCYVAWTTAGSGFTGVTRYMRAYINFRGSAPSASTTLIGCLTGALGNLMSLRYSASSTKVSIWDATGNPVVTSTLTPPASGWWRIEGSVTPGASTSTGAATCQLFTTNADGTTPDDSISVSANNFGTIAPVNHFAGIVNGNSTTWNLSNLAFSDTAAIGPDVTGSSLTSTVNDTIGLTDSNTPLLATAPIWQVNHSIFIGG